MSEYTFYKFPSISQFRNVITSVKHRAKGGVLPTLPFEGTIKLHGSNAGIVLNADNELYAQSRNRVLTTEEDNLGFAQFLENNYDSAHNIATIIRGIFNVETVIMYGEWAGKGVFGNVAIGQVEKSFYLFGVATVNEEGEKVWLDLKRVDPSIMEPFDRFHHIRECVIPMEIDFNNPGLIQNDLIDITMQVEEQCPYANLVHGVVGMGEGVVWKCTHPDYAGSDFMFKVKGEKHSATKIKKLAEVDVEKVKSLTEFVENTVTDRRFEQAIEFLNEMGKPLDQTSTGDLIRWIFNDIVKEEADIMEASAIDIKDIGKYVSTAARRRYFSYLDELA